MAASDEIEAVTVQERRVYCDGGGALGHPGVYLNIEGAGHVACPYCSRRFELAEGASGGSDH